MDKAPINKRYDYPAPKHDLWGIHLGGVGMRVSPPGAPYHVFEEGAPFRWQRGRVLRDFAVVCISEGRGTVRCGAAAPVEITHGDAMLIRPGVWHDYAPLPETGWCEHWFVFNGRLAEKLLAQISPVLPPVIHCGTDGELLRLLGRMLEITEELPPFAESIQAGLVIQAVATLQSLMQHQRELGGRDYSFVQKAKQRMAAMDIASLALDIPQTARELGVSPTHFRRVFKSSTGVSPQQYLISLKLQQAKRLMENPALSIADVARQTGFSDTFYFSRLFKSKNGVAPLQWRKAKVARA